MKVNIQKSPKKQKEETQQTERSEKEKKVSDAKPAGAAAGAESLALVNSPASAALEEQFGVQIQSREIAMHRTQCGLVNIQDIKRQLKS